MGFRTIDYIFKPQKDRLREVKAARKQRKRDETKQINEARFNKRQGKRGRIW